MNHTNYTTQALDEETRAHQERTASIRFRQTMVHGVGVAMVFGIATAACGVLARVAFEGTKVLAAVTFGATNIWALAGIAAIVAVGIGCLYMSSRYSSELVNLEQTRHAAQIAKGINGKSPEIEQQKPAPFPAQDKTTDAASMLQAANSNEPQTTVSNVQLQDKVVPIDALTKARA